jgi:cell division protein FtsI/penicillin-binding protein 2
MKINSLQNRIRLIFIGFVLLSLLIIARLYFLQVVSGDNYAEKADRQYVSIAGNTFDRGSIFFKDKKNNLISVAGLGTGYVIALNNRTTATDTSEYFSKLSKFLPIDASDFYSKISKKDDPYEVIADKIPADKIKAISDLNLPGVIIQKEKWRYYPGNSLGSQTIGFVGYNDAGDELEGRYGLEKYYDDTLSRKSSNLYVNTFAEIFSDINTNFIQDKGREGNIITSIDPEVQDYVEKVVAEANKKWGSKLTGGIVIDPKTGQIYSMTVYPNFNLNNFKNENVGIFSNPLISSSYEMGSIIKPLTMAAGIDSGAITSDTTYDDTGSIKVDGSTIHNYDGVARGIIPMQVILDKSLNLGVSFIATKMGKPTMLKYFQGYGIGSETGIDLPNEAAGNIGNLLKNLDNEKQVEYDTASFGQGISMTPIITARALCVLANEGKLIIPHVVDSIEYKTGLSKKVSYKDEGKQILKPGTAEEVTRMLVNVVDNALVNGSMKMNNYSIAAKTGTAQISRPMNEGGGYYPDKWLHSFFGYFPAYNPRFLVFLYTVEPQNVDYASKTLTDPFFDITKFLINYYEISPDR